LTTIFALIIVLGVLIFFHELGHFIMARLFGVGVERFSLGFGPRLFGFQRGRTDYRVSAIPLGGYVKMVGEDPGDEIAEEDIPESFTHQPVSRRILIVAAGPFFNLLLAVLIFFALYQTYGVFWLKPVIGEVSAEMPAQRAGIAPGDLIAAVNDKPVKTWEEMAAMIDGSGGRTLTLVINRKGDKFTLSVTPAMVDGKTIFGEPRKRYVLGIVASGDVVRETIGPVAAFSRSLESTWNIIRLTALGLAKMVTGALSTKELGGPILIAQMAGKQAEEGAGSLLAFMAFISVNLAILNFLPIPVLDGGHLLFYAIEVIRRKPVDMKTREVAQQFGMFVLISLMILVFYNDITRLME
jgi:regulator of sigma E protease